MIIVREKQHYNPAKAIDKKVEKYVSELLLQEEDYDYGKLEAIEATQKNIRKFIGRLVEKLLSENLSSLLEHVDVVDCDYKKLINEMGYTIKQSRNLIILKRADDSSVTFGQLPECDPKYSGVSDNRTKYFNDEMHAYMALIGKEKQHFKEKGDDN